LQQQVLSSLRAALGDGGQLWTVTHSPEIAKRPDVTNLIVVERGRIQPLAEPPPSADEPKLGLVVQKPPLQLPSLRSSKVALGVSDFGAISTGSSVYVDKTQFIVDVLSNANAVLLFPRPRRFGKSLNLSTLRFFVEKSPESPRRQAWFEDLRVWKSSEARGHFGRHPVIYLNLKVTTKSAASLFKAMRNMIRDLYDEHRYLLEADTLSADERIAYKKILRKEGDQEDYWPALKTLSRHLEGYHGERIMILVDEYDTPLHEAYLHGYLPEATAFFSKFFSAGLKDNPHLFKGVLTGVLRIARESLFSDLNNLSVYSILRPEFSTHFGFTEGEIMELCQRFGAPDLVNGLREWYNGYLFGDQVMFNPWSVLSCLNSEDKRLDPYWKETSSNDLLRRLLLENGRGLDGELAALLRGEAIHKPVDENLVLRTLDTTPDAVWSLALFSGYPRPTEPWRGGGQRSASLTIPNLEVRRTIEGLVRVYFSKVVGGTSRVERMVEALLRGDAEEVETYLNQILISNTSFHDLGPRTPERTYHVLMVGLTAVMEPGHDVRSNGPSGHGRYDLVMIPMVAGGPGVCLEFKRLKGKNVSKQLDQAGPGSGEPRRPETRPRRRRRREGRAGASHHARDRARRAAEAIDRAGAGRYHRPGITRGARPDRG
jgi:hypothetical protein